MEVAALPPLAAGVAAEVAEVGYPNRVLANLLGPAIFGRPEVVKALGGLDPEQVAQIGGRPHQPGKGLEGGHHPDPALAHCSIRFTLMRSNLNLSGTKGKGLGVLG